MMLWPAARPLVVLIAITTLSLALPGSPGTFLSISGLREMTTNVTRYIVTISHVHEPVLNT